MRLNNEGRRAIGSSRPRPLDEVGETVLMKVWERRTRFGGARGPPGTVEGGLMMLIGCEIFRTVGLFLAMADKETGEEIPGGKRSFLDERLAFRPKDAKKPAPLVDTVGTNERTEGEVPVATVELERVG